MFDNHAIAKYDLLHEKHIKGIIGGCDLVVNEAPYKDYISNPQGFCHSAYDCWAAHVFCHLLLALG